MDKRLKWTAYGAIIVFSILLMAGIGLVIIKPLNERAQIEIESQTKQAKESKAKADSLQAVTIHKVDSIIERKVSDSLAYVKEKESLKVVYIKKIKSYEAKIAAIDTMDVGSINSSFSVRKMLSDSSCSMW